MTYVRMRALLFGAECSCSATIVQPIVQPEFDELMSPAKAGQTALLMTFDQMSFEAEFDGIWECAFTSPCFSPGYKRRF